MTGRFLSLIGFLTLLPSLVACTDDEKIETPLSEEALTAISQNAGAPRDELARQVDELFTNEDVGETRAVIVMHGGEVAAERYAPGYGPDTKLVSWSMAKTVTAAMIGLLVSDGRLRLDESVPEPRWRRPGDPRGEITLRQLLQMRSGLRHTEAGDPPEESSEVRMLFLDGRDNMADWAATQPLEAEPGAKFEYSSNTTVLLADSAARALTDSDDPDRRRAIMDDYLRTRLFEPLGMDSIVVEYDAAGTAIGGSLMHATASDWARFGEFLRHGGSVRGTQLIPRRWVDLMKTPSPRSAHYGFQTWLNRPTELTDKHPLFPDRAPKTMFAMIGHMGQYVLISPEQKLTVVRLGHSDAAQREQLLQELADIMELYPVG